MKWRHCRGRCGYYCDVTSSDDLKPEFCTLISHNSKTMRNPTTWKPPGEERKSGYPTDQYHCNDCEGRTCRLLAPTGKKTWNSCPYKFSTGASWVKITPRYEVVE